MIWTLWWEDPDSAAHPCETDFLTSLRLKLLNAEYLRPELSVPEVPATCPGQGRDYAAVSEHERILFPATSQGSLQTLAAECLDCIGLVVTSRVGFQLQHVLNRTTGIFQHLASLFFTSWDASRTYARVWPAPSG